MNLRRQQFLRCRQFMVAVFLVSGSAGALLAQGGQPKNQIHIRLEIVDQRSNKASQKISKTKYGLRAAVWLEPLDSSLNSAMKNTPAGSSAEKFTIVQKNKTFSPGFLVIPVGSHVSFPNEDPFFHNVFSLFNGKRFDLGLYEEGSTRSVLFNRAGVSYIFCNIHPQMNAMIIAVDTPYYAVFNDDEDAVISGAIPGRYRIHLWVAGASEKDLHSVENIVTITGQTSSLGPLRVAVSQDLSTIHTNKFGLPYSQYSPATY